MNEIQLVLMLPALTCIITGGAMISKDAIERKEKLKRSARRARRRKRVS